MTLRLYRTHQGYELQDPDSRQRPLTINFRSQRLRYRINTGGKELLAKAVGARPGLRVLDCTAGLGIDSFILASRGCEVIMVERSHTLYLMLEDALARARADSQLAEIVARMRLERGDAKQVMNRLERIPDVISIDPMFPAKRKRAGVRGELQRLQQLIGKDEDTRGLVLAAQSAGCKRVVVKRPLVGGSSDGLTPSHVVRGKASRFDVYSL
ncbi:MAG: class I SAM-dependent methyltransferase [Pseudomonadales bacterium]